MTRTIERLDVNEVRPPTSSVSSELPIEMFRSVRERVEWSRVSSSTPEEHVLDEWAREVRSKATSSR